MIPRLVTIMMPAYNAEKYIGQAIESALDQTYQEWELIIVDDGSTDNTAEIASQYTDERIHIVSQVNQGEAAARNTALEHANGEFIAFLDADDAYLPHHLETTVSYLQENPNLEGVYTDGHYCNSSGDKLQTLSTRRVGPFEGHIYDEVLRMSCVFGPPLCVVLRREPIIQHSLRFDTEIVIGPDWDFFIQYTDIADFGYIDDYTCLYRVHESNISTKVGGERRAQELTKCRLKAINMAHFDRCSIETQTAVFYDLLVNLTRGKPDLQSEIISSQPFVNLPSKEQARLLRLMAGNTLVYENDLLHIGSWLEKANQLNPADFKGKLFGTLYKLSPALSKKVLSRRYETADPRETSPFADLEPTLRPSTNSNS